MADSLRSNSDDGAALAAWFQQVHALVRGEVPAEAMAHAWQQDQARVALYATFVREHVETAVSKIYPATWSWLGAAQQRWLTDYFRAHPPEHYELNEAARAFCGYLEQRAAADGGELPTAILELAQLEWLDWEVYRVPVGGREGVSEPARSGLLVNPTLQLVETRHGALDAFHAFLAQGALPTGYSATPEGEPKLVAAYRDLTNHHSVLRYLDDVDLFVLTMVRQGLEVQEAAAQGGVEHASVVAWLDLVADSGLVVRAGAGDVAVAAEVEHAGADAVEGERPGASIQDTASTGK